MARLPIPDVGQRENPYASLFNQDQPRDETSGRRGFDPMMIFQLMMQFGPQALGMIQSLFGGGTSGSSSSSRSSGPSSSAQGTRNKNMKQERDPNIYPVSGITRQMRQAGAPRTTRTTVTQPEEPLDLIGGLIGVFNLLTLLGQNVPWSQIFAGNRTPTTSTASTSSTTPARGSYGYSIPNFTLDPW